MSVDKQRELHLWIKAVSLRARGVIDNREYWKLKEMLESPDRENHQVANALIKQLNKKDRQKVEIDSKVELEDKDE